MLFGHGSWNTFHADTNQVFKASGGQYALITEIDGGYKVAYSATKSGAKVQYFNSPSQSMEQKLADARSYAKQYEPTGIVKESFSTQPRDAEVSSWSNWSRSGSCDLKRTRTVVVPAAFGGSTPELEEIKLNHFTQHATVSAWSDWGECNDGTQIRTRTITTAAKCGGSTPPPSALQQSRDCTVATTDDDDDGTTNTDDGTTITSDDEQDSIDTGDTTGSGTDDGTVTTQTSDVTIVSAGASSGMSTGKKVMVGVLVVGVIGGAVYYRAKKM
jgi:hypothetical protein